MEFSLSRKKIALHQNLCPWLKSPCVCCIFRFFIYIFFPHDKVHISFKLFNVCSAICQVPKRIRIRVILNAQRPQANESFVKSGFVCTKNLKIVPMRLYASENLKHSFDVLIILLLFFFLIFMLKRVPKYMR